MKKPVLIALAAVLLIVVVVGFASMTAQRAAREAAAKAGSNVVKVERGELTLRVVETGTVDAVKAVDLRSRASGRLERLFVDEGAAVPANALVAVIDPRETQLRVEQDSAQLRGARSSVARTQIEMEQQAVTLREQIRTAQLRLETLRQEANAQPTLTSSAIVQARSQLEAARRQRQELIEVSFPNQRNDLERQLGDARNSVQNSEREYERQRELERQGYVASRVVENAKLQLDLDRSRLASVQATYDRLDSQQRLQLQRADEDLRALEAAYSRAQANRFQTDAKRREYLQAISDLERARAALKQLGILRQTKHQAQATADQIASVLKDSQRQLAETQVRAPFAGVVTKRYIEVGDLVTALSAFSAGTPIVRIEDRSQMRVNLELNEIDVARIRRGMKVVVTVDALPGIDIPGIVQKIAPASTTTGAATQPTASADQVVKYRVEVVLDRVPEGLRSGMSAKCSMDVFRRTNVLRIPVAYLGGDKEGAYVMVKPANAAPGAKAIRKSVRTGASTGAFVEILSGVNEGEILEKPPFTGPQRTGFISAGDEE